MKLVDSMLWIDHFAGRPPVRAVAAALQKPDSLLVPTICLFEVFKKVLAERGKRAALRAAGAMRGGSVVPLDTDLAVQAAVLAREHRLAMADSVIYATARSRQAELLTRDAHFRGLPGVRYIRS